MERQNFDCEEIGKAPDQGEVLSRDMLLDIEGKSFVVRVANPSYIKEIELANQRTDPELALDDNIVPLDDVSDPDQVCRQLNEMPFEELKSYLVEQEE